MKQFVSLLIGLLMALPLAAIAAAETPEAEGSAAPFLYVMVAKHAKVIKGDNGDNGDYTLVVSKGDIDHVIEISEKPFKMANFISSDRIVETWKTGAGDFWKRHNHEGHVHGCRQDDCVRQHQIHIEDGRRHAIRLFPRRRCSAGHGKIRDAASRDDCELLLPSQGRQRGVALGQLMHTR